VVRAQNALRLTEKVVHEGFEALLEPTRVLEVVRQTTSGVLRLGQILARWPDPQTPFKGELGVPKRASWSGYLSLADVKAVGKVTGGTVNDVLLTAVSGALRQYMVQRGANPNGVSFHAVVPVNLRPPDEPLKLGNKFGLVFLKLPVGVADEVARLEILKQHMDELKQSPEPLALFGLLSVVGRAPGEIEDVLVQIFATKATAVMTNVPGPREQLYMCGAPLQDIMFWVPQSGRLGLGVSIISYNERVLLGIVSDAGLVPDPQAIVDAFHKEFDKMLRLVTMVEADEDAEMATTPRRCRATTISGSRCRNRAQPGSDTCRVHAPA
jgi:WS/DGAT/MGAT family acyltransferase